MQNHAAFAGCGTTRLAELAIRSIAFWGCLICVSWNTANAQTNDLAAQFNSPPPAEAAVDQAADFAAQFAQITPSHEANIADIKLNIPKHAVDLGTFTPPREARPSVLRDLGTGVASYYGRRFHGRLTANGERFNMNAMTAAHKTLPFGTRVRVTNPRNGRSVTVRINDRGPFIKGRTIDLSRGAAERIGMIASGHARVKLDIVSR